MPHDIKQLSNQLGKRLLEKGFLLAIAESCTGGGLAYALTDIPGSSGWFDCAFVTYSNTSKSELLDIPAALIAQHGVVSEEVADAMAKGAIAKSNATVSVAVTGIAGPGGAVPGKPVGTVCFAWAIGEYCHTERLIFHGERSIIRQQAIIHCLQGLLHILSDRTT